MTRILLAGCGPSGVAFCRSLIENARADRLDVTVLEPKEPGFGTAFRTDVSTHLLNVRAGGISLNALNLAEFAHWRLEAQDRWTAHLPEQRSKWDDYPPRRLFGIYVNELFKTVIEDGRRRGCTVRVEAKTLVDLEVDGLHRWIASTDDGERIGPFDVVVLALGHASYPKYAPALRGRNYISDPWDSEVEISPESSVAIIGTRLSGIDAALSLRAARHCGPITMASRSGALPSVKGPIAAHELEFVSAYVSEKTAAHVHESVTLSEIASIVRAEFELSKTVYNSWSEVVNAVPSTGARLRLDIERADRGDHLHWQSVMSALVPFIPDLWRLLDSAGKQQISSKYRTAWVTRVASFPAASASIILSMIESGELAIRSGLECIEEQNGCFDLDFSSSSEASRVHVDYVVNATGPGYAAEAVRSVPVTRRLVESGQCEIDPNGGIRVDPSTFAVLRPDGSPHSGLHVLGDFSRAAWGATNTVVGVVRQADLLASTLISTYGLGGTRASPIAAIPSHHISASV